MMSEQPTILILPQERTIQSMVTEALRVEGFTIIVTSTSQDVLDIVNRDAGRYIVFTDHFQYSPDAQAFAEMLFTSPVLHARVKIIGAARKSYESLTQWDRFLEMPFGVDMLFKAVNELAAKMQGGE